ncbi:Ribonuclease H-like superfamily [Sesbania bispinosa]|nr:Ribonuclease H-like superfamily [Sesbania bispinosa]
MALLLKKKVAHTIHVMSKSEGIKYLLQNAAITGRMSRWALLMSEYDVQLVFPNRLGCQALVDMMSICANDGSEAVTEEIRGEVLEVNNCERREEDSWVMRFYVTPSTPTAKDEALILWMRMALDLEVKRLHIPGDSNLVVKQIKGEYGVKEASLTMYREEAARIMNLFKEVEIQHIPRAENKHANVLATLSSKETGLKEGPIIVFRRVERPSHDVVPLEEIPFDWRKPIMEQFREKIFNKAIRDYQVLKGKLYRKSPEGLLIKCVTASEESSKLNCLHQTMCGQGGPSLYRRMQRIGVFWPTMKVHCDGVQDICTMCRDDKLHVEVNVIEEDWRRPLR